MLLVSDEFYSSLKQSISHASSDILITSAFVKTPAIKKLLEQIPPDVRVTIVSRWRKHDLLMSASDVNVYEMCRENGWRFGVDQNLHGKLYLIDDKDVYLGSANLTQRGMSLGGVANVEFGTKFGINRIDLDRISEYTNTEVAWINDDLYELLLKDLEITEINNTPIQDASWSIEVNSYILKPVNSIWVKELVFCSPEQILNLNLDDFNTAHDFELLNLDCDNFSIQSIKHKFRQSRVYSWSVSQLKDHENMNFGALSHALHNSLFDDPLPYRREVKEFVNTLFDWFKFMGDDFSIVQYERTCSVSLKR